MRDLDRMGNNLRAGYSPLDRDFPGKWILGLLPPCIPHHNRSAKYHHSGECLCWIDEENYESCLLEHKTGAQQYVLTAQRCCQVVSLRHPSVPLLWSRNAASSAWSTGVLARNSSALRYPPATGALKEIHRCPPHTGGRNFYHMLF